MKYHARVEVCWPKDGSAPFYRGEGASMMFIGDEREDGDIFDSGEREFDVQWLHVEVDV